MGDRYEEMLRDRAQVQVCAVRFFENASVLTECRVGGFSARAHTSRWQYSNRQRVCFQHSCAHTKAGMRNGARKTAKLLSFPVMGFSGCVPASKTPVLT